MSRAPSTARRGGPRRGEPALQRFEPRLQPGDVALQRRARLALFFEQADRGQQAGLVKLAYLGVGRELELDHLPPAVDESTNRRADLPQHAPRPPQGPQNPPHRSVSLGTRRYRASDTTARRTNPPQTRRLTRLASRASRRAAATGLSARTPSNTRSRAR